MASANVPTYNTAFVNAHADIRDFQHLGHGVWVDGLPAPGTYPKRAVIGPGVEHWRAQSAAIAGLMKLSQAAIVHPPPAPAVQQPPRSLIMRFVSATDTRAAYVRRSLIVRLHLPGRGDEIQSMVQEQGDADEADQDSITKRRRMAEMIREFTEREAGEVQAPGEERAGDDGDQDREGA